MSGYLRTTAAQTHSLVGVEKLDWTMPRAQYNNGDVQKQDKAPVIQGMLQNSRIEQELALVLQWSDLSYAPGAR